MNDFELERWYASESAKRKFGTICRAVNEQAATVRLLGTEDEPLLILSDSDKHPPKPGEIEITIDEAKADWSAVTTAAVIYGTRFRIRGNRYVRAVLYRHRLNRHPAEKYFRSASPDANRLAEQMERLANEVRKLGSKFSRAGHWEIELGGLVTKLDQAADIIERRFRQLWRISDGLPTDPLPGLH